MRKQLLVKGRAYEEKTRHHVACVVKEGVYD